MTNLEEKLYCDKRQAKLAPTSWHESVGYYETKVSYSDLISGMAKGVHAV